MAPGDDSTRSDGHGEWLIRRDSDSPESRRVDDTLFTLGAGGYAVRGSSEDEPPGDPVVLVSGVYTGSGPDQRPMAGPDSTRLDVTPPVAADERVLDLRSGVLWRQERGVPSPLRTLRFVSARRPGVMALRAQAEDGRLDPGEPLRASQDGEPVRYGHDGGSVWVRVGAEQSITAAAVQRHWQDGGRHTVDRLAAYGTGGIEETRAAAEVAGALGFDRLLAEHREIWADRWDTVDVRVPGHPDVTLAARFALFQLWCNVGGQGEAAVGPRGLSGYGYAGHVLWDADVFVLPAIASMNTELALDMIDYRVHRLRAAREAARSSGRAGARFPWESAVAGDDVTPTSGDLAGSHVPIRTGQLEEHITADVAWAVLHCARWSGEQRFRRGRRAALVVETARYWASRLRVDSEGMAHIDSVMGPDEYHWPVSDNAFTNAMARWNLRAAAEFVDEPERGELLDLAERVVVGFDAATGRYEQFAGYFDLEPLVVSRIGPPPLAADAVLGSERVAGSQVIKQPDVLMLHHLLPDEAVPGSLRPNLDFYVPRTSHGSSLSPGICAGLLARDGRPDEALDLLRIALRMDLDDQTGTTANGLHMATMGSVWQAFLFGFAGAWVRDGVLDLDPVLPSQWPQLQLRFRCLGRKVRLEIGHDCVEVAADGPLGVRLRGGEVTEVAGPTRFDLTRRESRLPT